MPGDVATMDRMLSEDFIGISMSGQVNTKAQQLERVRTRKLVITKVELSDMKVKLVGSVAIVTSRAEVEGTNEGVSVKGMYRYTRVYQRLPSGEWKITSFEATRIRRHPKENKTSRVPAPSRAGARTAIRLNIEDLLSETERPSRRPGLSELYADAVIQAVLPKLFVVESAT